MSFLKKIFTIKNFGVLILAALLALSCMMIWRIHQYDTGSAEELQKYSMLVNKYKIEKTNLWGQAFDKVTKEKYTKAQFEQRGHRLIIGRKYAAEIGHEGQHYEEQTISNVIEISPQSTQTKHFIVKSQINQQLFYSPSLTSSPPKDSSNQNLTILQKCLELDNIELKQKLHYFVDRSDRFWLLSHPHNNVLLIQVYDCKARKLVKKIFHQPLHNNRSYMINQLVEVSQKEDDLYEVKLLTYESHEYVVRIRGSTYEIQEVLLNPSYSVSSQQLKLIPHAQQQSKQQQLSSTSSSSSEFVSYLFLDPLNKIFQQEFNHLVFSTIKDFTEEVRVLLGGLGISTKAMNAFIRDKLKEYEREKTPEYLDYDIQLADDNNDCLVNLQYHIPSNSTSETNTSLTRLGKHLLDTRTPVFHNIDDYDQYDIVQILKDEKTPKVSQFKRLSLQKGYQKEYISHNFYSIYHTYPDSKIHFLGLAQKVFYLHPKENINEDDYVTIRSKTGALIMHGNKIKGVYEDKPLGKTEQVHQKYFIEGNQVLPGIYQAHSGYQSLYSVLSTNRVQLINGLSGKTMLTFQINHKQGYEYANSFLFNNEWWVVQYNKQTGLSELTKHELYVEKSYPKQIDSTKRTYGKVVGSEFAEGDDDLAAIFREYIYRVSADGVVVLDLFRCLDQFYYVQFCDAKGKNYAIARIHYKRLSNRLPKDSQQYGSDLEQRLIVQPKDMVKEKQKMDPFLLVLNDHQNKGFHEGIEVLIKQNKFNFKNYSFQQGKKSTIINSMKKLNQFDFLPYVMLSRQQIEDVWSDRPKSTQEITLLNMRVLVENAKKKFMIETQLSARTRLKYFGALVAIILLSIIVKILISDKVSKIQSEKEGQKSKDSNQKGDQTSTQDKTLISSPLKSKGNKKEKIK